ncbi:Tetratricopeptide repeat-containing protein [Trichlorobacter thiogenes]|uniref:Tetratricopeptide repeat-containing protein n=1 Tax=Trichlorobacter thiogenes TaxID=115783 RepID=A0A1T4JXM4_9BACT|nr:tetratricopeptide repeat protein [Trichlorobacter thiogenes]SJZ34859.1 Tetratricopeptide repeat-containing protein [Trichlorobacter thiogenes]
MSSLFDQSSDAIFSGALSAQSQRTNLANYALQQAAYHLQNNNNESAIKEFKKALAFDPENDTAHTYLGNIYLSQDKTKEAIKEFKESVRLQPLSVNSLVNLGNAYLQDKNYTEAEKSLKKAARMDPLNPVPDYTLGHLYLNTDRLNEAEAQFRKAEKISPRDGNVFYSLGTLYNKQGKYEEAAKNLEKALTLKKNFSSANYELGVAYHGMGETDKAQEQLSILNSTDYSLAQDLKYVINKPKIVSMDTAKSGGFVELLGAGTPLWALDPTLLEPDSSKEFSITFTFSEKMDIASVSNPLNWSITRAKGGTAGYYNNTMPVTSKEASIPKFPLSVTYNDLTNEATIKFRLNQNSDGTATIDPSHLVFSFKGKDASGRSMDSSADEIDGYALKAF